MNYLIILTFLVITNCSQFPTCSTLPESRTLCEAQNNCKYYEWTNSACFNECSAFAQSTCFLLFNCKWENQECLSKNCLDYTQQGLIELIVGQYTCQNTPGCKWYWNKCRTAHCSDLNANTQQKCSKTYCNWDELNLACNDKQCNEYDQSICQSLLHCQFSNNECVEITINYSLMIRIIGIILLFII